MKGFVGQNPKSIRSDCFVCFHKRRITSSSWQKKVRARWNKQKCSTQRYTYDTMLETVCCSCMLVQDEWMLPVGYCDTKLLRSDDFCWESAPYTLNTFGFMLLLLPWSHWLFMMLHVWTNPAPSFTFDFWFKMARTMWRVLPVVPSAAEWWSCSSRLLGRVHDPSSLCSHSVQHEQFSLHLMDPGSETKLGLIKPCWRFKIRLQLLIND